MFPAFASRASALAARQGAGAARVRLHAERHHRLLRQEPAASSCGRRRPSGANFEFSPTMKALEPFRENHRRLQRPGAGDRPGARRRSWRSRARDRDLPHRRASVQDRRRRLPAGHLGRSDRREGVRQAHAAVVAGARRSSRSRSPATATRATPARTCRCRGGARRARCRRKSIRARCSSGCSATARAPIAAARRARLESQKSVLDYVTPAACRVSQGSLGAGDKRKLDEYLEAVRDIERRIQRAEEQNVLMQLPHMERPSAVPDDYLQYSKLMMDLQVIAWQTDMTRVASFMMGRDGSNRAYREIGISDGHHSISHHQQRSRARREADQDRRAAHVAVRVPAEEAAGRRPTATVRCSITRSSCSAAA